MNRKLFYNKILKRRVNSKVSLHLTRCPQTNLLSHHLTAHTYYFHIHPGLCIEFLYLHSSHRVRLSSTMLSQNYEVNFNQRQLPPLFFFSLCSNNISVHPLLSMSTPILAFCLLTITTCLTGPREKAGGNQYSAVILSTGG